jgi:ABC-type tungstate transport system substrate-binding protein
LWAILEAGQLGRIIALSLAVSVSATGLATLFGTPLGAALAVYRFPGRQILVVTFNALLGLPPVVVGLAQAKPLHQPKGEQQQRRGSAHCA